MAINSIGSSTSLLGQSVLNIKNQLNTLQVQLATGEKSTTYSGMGTGEGFAIAARAQLSNITGYQSTITNVGTTISAANTALQALASTSSNVETAANSGSQTLNSNGQTAGQVTAISQLSSMLSILNTQGGNGYIFSGAATNTPSVATADAILNGNGAQAGLTQIISERQQADLGTTGLGRLTVSAPTTTSVSLAQDSSPFGIKLGAVSSTLTGATVTGPAGSPAAISVDLGATKHHAQHARRHHPVDQVDGDDDLAAAHGILHHRHDPGRDGRQSANGGDDVDHHGCQHLAGCRFRDGGLEQFL